MKYLIWDFDGTLGYRRDGMWSMAFLEILRQEKPELHVTMEQIKPYLQVGFPWHNSSQPHTEIKSPDEWWNSLDKLFEQAFLGIGINSSDASRLAKRVRHVYPSPPAWQLFDDVLPTLGKLSVIGWTNLVLSNHVPELRQIIHFLELDKYISKIFNSAETGYEKPHPQAFMTLLTALDEIETIWMIGDSMEADILGANAVGLSGILVRKFHAKAKYYCATLNQISEIIAL